MPHELMIPHTVDRRPQELQAIANAALRRSGYAALAFVTCDVQEGEIVLEGCVPTYHLKQLAQAFVRRAAGDARLDNRLAVRGADETTRRT
jgi:osmotically-inducible protein OsmY